jgi:nicotinate-nucleotide pyrophosphorylase (carboxylating)
MVLKAVYAQLDADVGVKTWVEDGTTVTPGDLVCEVSGKAQAVLAGERTALNFLQQLSGVATMTSQFVAQTAGTNAVILDTRKTTPGWRLLQKYAVRMGGGQNHRIGLYDAVMIKDNHIDAVGGITAAVNAVRVHPDTKNLCIIVEVRNEAELKEATGLKIDQIMLDNMTNEQMRAAVEWVAGRVALEASGNMSVERVGAVAETGVDFISVGALTHSAPALDLSMRLSE